MFLEQILRDDWSVQGCTSLSHFIELKHNPLSPLVSSRRHVQQPERVTLPQFHLPLHLRLKFLLRANRTSMVPPSVPSIPRAARILILGIRVRGIRYTQSVTLRKECELLGREAHLGAADARAGLGVAALVERELDAAREEELLVPEVEQVDD